MGDVGRFGGLNSRVLDGDAVAVLNELLRRLRAGGDSLSENPASLGGASGQALGQHTPPVVVHPVSVIGCSAEVVDDWTGQEDEGELSLAAGEMIEIVNDFGDPQGTGMWYGKDPDGGEGTFPASHVRVVHDTPPAPQRTPPPPPGPIHRAESLGAYSLSRPGSAMSDSSASSAGSRGPAQERPKCVICLAEDSEPNPVAVAMVPCGHQILCEECHRDGALRAGMTCPTCRRNIASMIRVYV
ncbi:hypothetical protein DFJ74DRAFT_695751 [Hyaloraphidium curvatum]|nr:hypothetical protein DFJ74DRAFT_695751 [Hyaloraphidium curvatum]